MRTKHLTATAIAAVAVIVSALVFLYLYPFEVTDTRYRIEGETEWQVKDPPLSVDAGEKTVTVEAVLFIPNLRWTHAILTVGACLDSMEINGQVLPLKPDLCLGDDIWLQPEYLKQGNNHLLLGVRNSGRPVYVHIRPLSVSPIRAIPWLSICIALAAVWLAWVRQPMVTRAGAIVSGALLFGILLRIAYLYGTPYNTRAHDTAGHVQYIQQMLESFAMPRAAEGWSKHHPPLYYTITSAWLRLLRGVEFSERLRIVQVQSLVFSAITLAIALRLGWETLRQRDLRTLAVYSFAIATVPGIVYTGTRISNDALVQVWIFLTLLLLMRWWRTSDEQSWFGTVFATVFGILTKLTAMIMVPIAACCLLLKSDKSRIYRTKLGLATLLVFIGTTGWFFYERLAVDHSAYMLTGNRLSDWLRVDNSIRSVTVFNPLRIARQPYNMLSGDENGSYFWEFYLRSMFFSKFRFKYAPYDPLAATIVVIAMLLIPVFMFGLIGDLRENWRRHAPLWLCLVWIFAAQIIRRHISPFAPSQDFRLTIITAVPIVFYLAEGLRRLPKPLRLATEFGTYLLIGLCTIFIVTLSLASKA